MNLEEVRQEIQSKEASSISLLKCFVEIESFSYDKEGVDRLSSEIQKTFGVFPVQMEVIQEEKYGNHLKVSWGEGNQQITVLSHLDTVYPRGTLVKMPFQVDETKVYGPGVYDMKASYVMMYHVFTLLKEKGDFPPGVKIVWLLTSDEEIGSPNGKQYVIEEAKKSLAVLVLEPPTEDGSLKTARKGGGRFTVAVKGISAHAGVNPGDGANAIEELCRQIVYISGLADPVQGTTINTGEIKGGTLFNVVPEYGAAEIDVRVGNREEAVRIEEALRNLSPVNPRTQLKVTGGIYRPPMERGEETEKLFYLAKKLGEQLGINLTEASTGGGSDGNFAASTGVPVLDGLGVFGGFAHSPDEFLRKISIAERTALLYGILLSLVKNESNNPT
ncbi:hypothetical protein AM500_18720 [Bacillus sp. FJAT-18017]|uniref:M20 family metallopeptidase n=1 Tax=Bacillus sp. FJAT-18017 TaxID=1705566 RepID=UPI0006B00EB0|nr:M20 family metallopeptidase [Bacillus sp. FJAT-18017]ALC91589.1 hypothetical protein AM500_18720 [Bacillus sp. FJAT-18017]